MISANMHSLKLTSLTLSKETLKEKLSPEKPVHELFRLNTLGNDTRWVWEQSHKEECARNAYIDRMWNKSEHK